MSDSVFLGQGEVVEFLGCSKPEMVKYLNHSKPVLSHFLESLSHFLEYLLSHSKPGAAWVLNPEPLEA